MSRLLAPVEAPPDFGVLEGLDLMTYRRAVVLDAAGAPGDHVQTLASELGVDVETLTTWSATLHAREANMCLAEWRAIYTPEDA